jgi:hypothetical protein
MAFTFETIDNISNDINFDSHAISFVSDEELNTYISNITELNAKFKTPDDIKALTTKFSSLLSKFLKKSEEIYANMDENFNNIKKYEKLKNNLKQLIDGTFECIKINMKNSDFDIILPINTLTDENIQKLFEKKIISNDVYQEEMQWRQINKDYPTNETKLLYIQELDSKIVINKQKMCDYISKINHINIIKYKIHNIRKLIFNNELILEILKKYNIDDSYPMDHIMKMIPKHIQENQEIVQEKTSDKVMDVISPQQMLEPSNMDFPPEPEYISDSIPVLVSPPPSKVQTYKKLPTTPSTSPPPSKVQTYKKLPTTPSTSPPPLEVQTYKKTSPSTKSVNIAPFDINLETICKYGLSCAYKDNPLRCGYNHNIIGKKNPNINSDDSYVIKKNDIIPPEYCTNEKLWESTRCRSVYCTSVHCTGRVAFLIKYKEERKRHSDIDIEFDNYLERRQIHERRRDEEHHYRDNLRRDIDNRYHDERRYESYPKQSSYNDNVKDLRQMILGKRN